MKKTLKELGKKIVEAQKNQPSLGAELQAAARQGREDLLTTLMGPLAGATREPGAPGTPTPQQVTEGLEQRGVDKSDRLQDKLSLAELRGYAKEREAVAAKAMEQPSQHREQGLEI